MTPTKFVLGPFLDNVIDSGLSTIAVAQVAGLRSVKFHDTPTKPGGRVFVKLQPPLNPGDVMPVNVYAFFVQPAESVPAVADRTTDWFFKSGAPSQSIHSGAADSDGLISLTVPGVKPSLQPYFVQIVLEYPS